ncbi:MAG: protein kinase domain-containing protein [Verrucomicrobiales bacterium]
MPDPPEPGSAPRPILLPHTSELSDTLVEGVEATAAGTKAPASGGAKEVGREGERWISRYRLIDILGEGGFGVVWKAQQEDPVTREVALKVVKPGMASGDILARFAAERQALTVMEHPNIAALLDAGQTDDGCPFFVMPLVRGKPVTKYCDEARLDVRRRLELFAEVCEAVEHAHRRGVLHRDLKPSNILVEELDGKPTTRIIDFGIAKMMDPAGERERNLTLTGKGMVIGTPQYMSPEQASSQPDLDTRSDVYALGAVLYELLTGTPPLDGSRLKTASWDEVLRMIREIEVARPSSRLTPVSEAINTLAARRQTTGRRLVESVRGELDWIVLRALEKDRERRYPGAAALGQDLRHYLNGEPVSAGPPSGVYRAKKFLQRHWLPVSAAAAVGFSVIAGGALSLWQWQAAKTAEWESLNLRHAILGIEVAEAARGGDPRGTLDLIEKARRAGYPDEDALIFFELEALDELGDPSLPELLNRLDRSTLSPAQQPRLDYWRGDRAIQDGRIQEGRQLLESALARGLPDLEQALALGLLSPTAAEAITHYQDAASLSPRRAMVQRNLVLALLLTGRTDQARDQLLLCQSLFPQSRDFFVLQALLEAFQQRPEDGLAALERIADPNDPAKALFRPLIESLARFSQDFVLAVSGNPPKIDFLGQIRLTTAIGNFSAAAGDGGSLPGLTGLAPALTQGARGMVDGLWNYHLNDRGEKAAQILRETLKINGEGTLWALLGSIEFGKHRHKEAVEAFRHAQAAPALFKDVAAVARLMEGAAEAGRFGLHGVTASLEPAGAAFQDAFESDLPPEVFESILKSALVQDIALKLPDRFLARRIAARLPKDSPRQLAFLAKIEFAESNRTKAQEIAERAVSLHPGDTSLQDLAASIRDGTLELPEPESPPAPELPK